MDSAIKDFYERTADRVWSLTIPGESQVDTTSSYKGQLLKEFQRERGLFTAYSKSLDESCNRSLNTIVSALSRERWWNCGWSGGRLHTSAKRAFAVLLRDTGWKRCRWWGWRWGNRLLGRRRRIPGLQSGKIVASCLNSVNTRR